ncbi:DUF484 family protein [Candidatus Magnetaquicoccus inordinatus]|uniref:DUF484 family protein n=1 Tax=Candidatus Magnetaquicoccus inordinatus TaxID=2496818 RepID=UPI00187D6AD6|nr:DUF484 family protein [Candidatus Magnetaquicoccus inordinatus]
MNTISSLKEAQVLAWLQQNPDFLPNHPELLPTTGADGKVISLEAGQLSHLRRQNDQLRDKLDAILNRLLRNEEIYRAFHAIQTRMILASSPWAVIAIATQEPENLFNIKRVTVSLTAKESSLVQLFHRTPPPEALEERLFVLDHSLLTQILGEGSAPVIRVGREGKNKQCYFGQITPSIRSEALVPLYAPDDGQAPQRRLIGALNLGGEAPNRFLPSDATDLLQDLANVFSHCLMRMTSSSVSAS